MKKTYEEILKEQNENKNTDLIKIDIDRNALINVKNIDEALAVANKFVPELQKQVFTSEVGLPAEKKQQWLKTIDESMHAMEIVPQRRTMTEKLSAVLQQNRFPTAAAKFHQAVLESSSYAGMLLDETFGYEEFKIKLEKKFYKYQKKLQELQKKQDEGEDTFILEKDLDILKLRLTKEIISLKHMEKGLQNKREELMEWSEIKKELYQEAMQNGEIWSPDAIDGDVGFQEIPLALRHLQNFLILKQNPSDGDISSVLNIEGLALTAVRQGMKTNRLGLYISSLNDEQISLIFKYIYGWDVVLQRPNGFLVINHGENQMIFPTTLETFNLIKKAQEQK